MKLFSILIFALLTGCSTTVPVVAKFPDAPKTLTERCPPLQKIESESATIVDLHKTVVENYTSYYECAVKVDQWNEWHVKQKKVFENVK
jgi:hypothetical protein